MVIVGAVWLGSSQWEVHWTGTHLALGLSSGALSCNWNAKSFVTSKGLSFYRIADAERDGFPARATFWKRNWLPHPFPPTGPPWGYFTPLWSLLVLFAIPTTRAWLARPLSPSACPRCGYDFTGLPAKGGCPECGAPWTPTTS